MRTVGVLVGVGVLGAAAVAATMKMQPQIGRKIQRNWKRQSKKLFNKAVGMVPDF